MSEIIDNVAKALASGLPRRKVLLRWAGGLAALTPLADAAARSKSEFAKYEQFCSDWCRFEFASDPQIQSCMHKAKKGKGPCYSSQRKGPGFVCAKGNPCPSGKRCCPTVFGDSTTRDCCTPDQQCLNVNSTNPHCTP